MDADSAFGKWLLWAVAVGTMGMTWLWAGMLTSWLKPFVWLFLVIFVALVMGGFAAARPGSTGSILQPERFARSRWWFFLDPFFYSGALFLAFLVLQWSNSGRTLVFDRPSLKWIYLPPPHPGWPSAINKAEAAQMLQWFFSPWVAALVLRSPWVSRRGVMQFLRFFAYQAGLLALFGLVQFVSGTHSIYWLRPLQCDFFASFGYANHAAAYFVMMGLLAAGFLYREIFRRDPATKRSRIVFLACSLLLCLMGANFSLSRAGVILAWTMACFVATYGLLRGWRSLSPAGKFNLALATLATVSMFYFAVAGFGGRAIHREFRAQATIHHVLLPILDEVDLGLGEERLMLWQAAWRMWHEEPWLGLGGWGYRYRVVACVPQEKLGSLTGNAGMANVHCDLLQFLVEFGAIGSGLLLAGVGCLFWSLIRTERKTGAVWVMVSIGLCLVVVHSLIDLPFRCPAIILTWVLLLAALPRVTGGVTNQRESASAVRGRVRASGTAVTVTRHVRRGEDAIALPNYAKQ